MLNLFLNLSAGLYLLVLIGLFIYGVNFLFMIYLSRRVTSDTTETPETLSDYPTVVVQLPIYNELYVAKRVIDAAAALDYPHDRLAIQVLDDSTDETQMIVAETVKDWQSKGINIVHLCRPNREGFKAGALQAGLQESDAEFVAMFDADFVPPASYLKETLPHFQPNTAFVQARWGHLNAEYSLFTYLQSIAIDAHFVIEQYARAAFGFWFNFNGTSGIWRRTALEDAGGWQADTLTEDLDISYRALLKGWEARYLRQLVAPAELPVSMIAFRRQQHRWARGSLECAGKLGGDIWRSEAPLVKKIQGSIHLTNYLIQVLIFLHALLFLPMIFFINAHPELNAFLSLGFVFFLVGFANIFFYIEGQQQLGKAWRSMLPKIFFATVVSACMMFNTLRAALQIMLGKQEIFERTAKFGIQGRGQAWTQKRYQIKLDKIAFWEIGFAVYNLVTIYYALQYGQWIIAFYATFFAIGLLYISFTTIWQSWTVWKANRDATNQISRQPDGRPTWPIAQNRASATVVPAANPMRNSQIDRS